MDTQEAGRKGGLATKQRGPDYYRKIGKKGGNAGKGSKKLRAKADLAAAGENESGV
jgi:general stress protein YciG